MPEGRADRYRWLLHVDLDQFQVAVERLRREDLIGRPVIVGGNGDPTEARKVVTCASYEARDLGVTAGMPLRRAHRKAPDAVYLPLDADTYLSASEQVMATLRDSGHPVEVWGWDEAFLGVQRDDVDPPEPEVGDAEVQRIAETLRRQVAEVNGLACRVGISDNKQRAKMATGFAKQDPERPVFLLDDRNWLALMGDRPCGELWSVGPRTAARLAERGIDSVTDLIAAPLDDLIGIFGPHQGNWLYVLCRGGGDPTITTDPPPARSHSHARTFPVDLIDADEIRSAAAELTREVLEQVVSEGRTVFRVAVTVRTATFYTRTKSRKLRAPTVAYEQIEPVVVELLDRFEAGRPVRLLAVRLDLVPVEEG